MARTYSTKDVAARWRFSPATIARWAAQGMYSGAPKRGGRWVFNETATCVGAPGQRPFNLFPCGAAERAHAAMLREAKRGAREAMRSVDPKDVPR